MDVIKPRVDEFDYSICKRLGEIDFESQGKFCPKATLEDFISKFDRSYRSNIENAILSDRPVDSLAQLYGDDFEARSFLVFLSHNWHIFMTWGIYEELLVRTYTLAHPLPLTAKKVRDLLSYANRQKLRSAGSPMPDGESFQLYRGVGTASDPKQQRGVSWTDSPNIASWFAHWVCIRYGGKDPAVFSLTVPRDKVFFCYNDRNEREFVIDWWPAARPKRLKELPSHVVEGFDRLDKKTGAEPTQEKLVTVGAADISSWQVKEMNEPTFDKLRAYAESIFRCDHSSVHGPAHWRRVEDTIMLIAPETGADIVVGRLFAIFHDSCRLDDGSDLDHGPRAADLISSLLGSGIPLDPKQCKQLIHAIRHHTSGQTSDDLTIGTCWDADRLDLGRVGMIPMPAYMSTEAGKEIATLGTKYLYMQKKGIPVGSVSKRKRL